MSATLNESSTAEIVEQVQDQTIPEPSSNGKAHLELSPREVAIAEGRDPDEVPQEEAVETEPATEATPAEEVASTPAEPAKPWYADYDLQVARDYGLDDEDIKGLNSREEFGRVIKAVAKQRQARTETKPAESEAPAEEYVDQPVVNGKLNVEYWRKHKEDYEGAEAILAMAESQKAIEDKLSAKEKADQERWEAQQRAEAERVNQQEWSAFHSAASRHRPDFYGKVADDFGNPVQLSSEQNARRQQLYNEIYWQAQRIAYEQQAQGLRPSMPGWEHLIKQAEQRAFPAEMQRIEEEKRKVSAREQNKTIRPAAGSGATHARREVVKESDDVTAIANDPEVVAAYEKMTGTRR